MVFSRWEKRIFPFKGFWKNFLLYSLTLGLIGPVLSFFTLQSQSGYPYVRALLYAVVSFAADVTSIVLFALVLTMFLKNFEVASRLSLFAYLPMWIFDLFDAYQPLRFLSNLGFIFSIILLHRIFREKKLPLKVSFALIILWSLLYALDAAVSEYVAASPLVKILIASFGK